MSNLSLTEFVDIASVMSAHKVSKIKAAKNKPSYHPATDFYRPLRERIINIHKINENKSEVKNILYGITDSKKKANYQSAINGYIKWWGKKDLIWFDPTKTEWSSHGISVSINPELGLTIKGEPHLLKLYFKSEPLSKVKLDVTLQLMVESLRPIVSDKIRLAVLDVRQSKLVVAAEENPALSLALDAELAFISSVWGKV